MIQIKNKVNWLKHNPLLTTITAWYIFMWSWVLFTDTLDLAGNPTQGFIVALFVLVVNVAMATAIMWQGLRAAKWLLNEYPSWIMVIIVPLLALADFLVAWIPSTLWIGPQGRIDSLLPLGSVSLLTINTPVGFAARIIGFFGLAGFFWIFVVLLSDKKRRLLAIWPATVLIAVSFLGWAIYKTPNGSEFGAKIISENLDNRVEIVDGSNTGLVVFPEYGLDNINQENIEERIQKPNSDNNKTYFLGSQQIIPRETTSAGHYNTLLYGNNIDGITKVQDKYRLIPGGEDLPFLLRTLLRATNQKDTLDYFSYAKGVIKGSQQLQPLKINDDVIVGAAVCSSIISPQDYREFTQNGATVLSNSASLTIFKGSPLFAWQQKSFAKFMAVSNSRYFLQSANAARAYALDNNGNTSVEKTGIETIDVTVKTNSTKTLYTWVGEWLPAVGALFASILLYKHAIIRHKNNTDAHKQKKHTKKRKH